MDFLSEGQHFGFGDVTISIWGKWFRRSRSSGGRLFFSRRRGGWGGCIIRRWIIGRELLRWIGIEWAVFGWNVVLLEKFSSGDMSGIIGGLWGYIPSKSWTGWGRDNGKIGRGTLYWERHHWFLRWGDVRWGEVRWGEVRWGEAAVSSNIMVAFILENLDFGFLPGIMGEIGLLGWSGWVWWTERRRQYKRNNSIMCRIGCSTIGSWGETGDGKWKLPPLSLALQLSQIIYDSVE